MLRPTVSALILLACHLGASSVAAQSPQNGWRPLLDKSLDGWEVYTGVPHKSVEIEGREPSTSENGREGTPVGLGDPLNIFSLRDSEDGKSKVLHITGQVYAGLTSNETFGDYHLALEYKWGEAKWPPRKFSKRDSGLLVHGTGDHGAFWNVWLRSIECQIQETDAGDLITLAGTSAKVPFETSPKGPWSYQKDATPVAMGAGTKYWGVKRSENHELPNDWNRIDVMTVGSDILFAVNGHVVMQIEDAKVGSQENGQPLTQGRIQIQSEAAEVMYRNIRIRPLKEMPAIDAAMPIDHPLRRRAHMINDCLNEASYQTLVHGDAKVANFCFNEDRTSIAAVDFQYVGGGCGMKDVAYFLGSCLSAELCEQHDRELLDHYFMALRKGLTKNPTNHSDLSPTEAASSTTSGTGPQNVDALEAQWRHLYPIAWADFNRFLLGWCPEHPKLNRYAEKMNELAFAAL